MVLPGQTFHLLDFVLSNHKGDDAGNVMRQDCAHGFFGFDLQQHLFYINNPFAELNIVLPHDCFHIKFSAPNRSKLGFHPKILRL
jgi:hypothetical protein